MSATDSGPSRRVRTVRALAGACHPVPTLAVTLLAVLLAAGVGLAPGTVVLLGFAVFAGQLSIGWSNDRLDAARDSASGRRDKPAAAGGVPLRLLTAAGGLALAAAAISSFLLGPRAGIAAMVLVASGWAYNLGLKATVWSGLTYAIGFGALPAVPYLAQPGQPWPPWWAPVTGALLGLGAHIANVLPDMADDIATGVRGLPHRIGPRGGVAVMTAAFTAASLVLVLGPPGPPSWPGLLAAAVTLLLAGVAAVEGIRRPGRAFAFRAALAIALLDVVLFVLAT
ncbi:ubiquinone biosynthesis protein UbiA [Amycolatopsis antarctica]|uniref:Ubiquinone biosynthesis protein UbiA n=1 Tax=Amycolatopsis antarctica TaxID=1854586 RepID=A0A263D0S0_9PSEU|nr:UbiA family prenyltransferase [Amycolatopsis antarctica]OZM72022.1 ubiquinone biosynthesis protein UbiA [Amycolatopsis antarctica]